jgi:hypothetical protein
VSRRGRVRGGGRAVKAFEVGPLWLCAVLRVGGLTATPLHIGLRRQEGPHHAGLLCYIERLEAVRP